MSHRKSLFSHRICAVAAHHEVACNTADTLLLINPTVLKMIKITCVESGFPEINFIAEAVPLEIVNIPELKQIVGMMFRVELLCSLVQLLGITRSGVPIYNAIPGAHFDILTQLAALHENLVSVSVSVMIDDLNEVC